MAGTYAARRAGPWDQRRLHGRDDVASFLSEPLQRTLDVIGTVRLAPPSPGEVCEVVVDVGTTATRFRPGHRVGVQIAGSNFPRFDLCPRTGRARKSVHHGPARPSRLLLPVHRHD